MFSDTYGRVETMSLTPALKGLCCELAGAQELGAGLEAVGRACDGVFPFYRVALVFPGRDPQRYYVAAAWSHNPEEELLGYDFSIQEHPLEPVVARGSTVVRTDPSRDHSDGVLLRLFAGEHKAEEMGVPLALGEVRGLLVFASRVRGAFDAAAQTWAEDVARIVSLWARPWSGPDAPLAVRDQYEALLEGSLDGIAVLKEGALVYANASFREIFGFRGTDPRQIDLAQLLAPHSVDSLHEALGRLQQRPRVLPRLEVEARGATGRPLHLDLGLQLILFQGEPAVLVQVHNATERAERENQIRESYGRIDQLIHTLAHDIRGPLTTILGFSEVILRKELPEEKLRDTIELIWRVGRRLRDLVEGLLDYSALGSSLAPVMDIPTEEILRGVEAELEGLLTETDTRLQYRKMPPILRGRPIEVGRIFKNLVENAVKYAKPGKTPRVTVSCVARELRHYVFCVEDLGVGIRPEELCEIFRLFHRGEGGGLGVGLSIVERAVQGHGGRIWVESRVGEGSKFYFTLPSPEVEDS